MCLAMLIGTCFWCDAVLVCQGSLLGGQGLESAYLQHDCFGSATAGKMTHWSLNLLNDCDWNCLAHTWILHDVDVLWGFCSCSCGAHESSFDSISLKSDHICYILCTDISSQGIEIHVHELHHHICCSNLASYVFFYCHKVSWPDLLLDLQESCMFFAYQLVFSSYCVCLWEALFSGVSLNKIWVACRSQATCLIWCTVAFELLNFFASCQTLLAGNLSRSTLPSVTVLDTKFSSCKKNQKCLDVIFHSFRRIFCEVYLCLYSIVPFVDAFISLMKTGQEIKPGSHLIGLQFTKIFKPLPNCVKIQFVFG